MDIKRIAQAHGIFLMILTFFVFFYISLVPSTGRGLYAFLKDNFWAIGGLSQAYLIMFVFGLSLFIGVRQSDSRVWNWVGALPHFIFLILIVINFAPLYVGLKQGIIGSLMVHSF